MNIQWYPGHMTKAIRMMEENVKLVDSVIYVIDSRAVVASFNPLFEKLIANKTVLYVLNKSDLVDKTMLNKWIAKLKSEGKKVIAVSSTGSGVSKVVVDAIMAINKEKIDRYIAKGANKSIRTMVIGIPNSGKSTLINALCGAKRTVTGDRPGVTRGKQWVVLSKGVELLDTPGTLSPSFENQDLALHLAFIGSIKDDILDIAELSCLLIAFYRTHYPELLQERYKLNDLDGTDFELLEKIAVSRGFVLKGGLCDSERASKAVLDDFRKQRLGKTMLEWADDGKK